MEASDDNLGALVRILSKFSVLNSGIQDEEKLESLPHLENNSEDTPFTKYDVLSYEDMNDIIDFFGNNDEEIEGYFESEEHELTSDADEELSLFSDDDLLDQKIERMIEIALRTYQTRYVYKTYLNAYHEKVNGVSEEEVSNYEAKYKMLLWLFQVGYAQFYKLHLESCLSDEQLSEKAIKLLDGYENENDLSGFSAYLSEHFQTLTQELEQNNKAHEQRPG